MIVSRSNTAGGSDERVVVGDAGCINSHMVKHLLERGHEVAVCDNLSHGHQEVVPANALMESDLLDGGALAAALGSRRFGVTMHIAAPWHIGGAAEKRLEYYPYIRAGSLNFLGAAGGRRGQDFLLIDLLHVRQSGGIPINAYGASKLMMHGLAILSGFSSEDLGKPAQTAWNSCRSTAIHSGPIPP